MHARCASLVAVALVTALVPVGAAGARRPKQATCGSARFLLPAGSPPLLGAIAPVADGIVLDTSGPRPTLALTGGCEPVRAVVKAGRRGTKVRARWRRCGETRAVAFTGRIDPACATLTGTLAMKRAKPRRFTAGRSACGDNLVDGPAGEACEFGGAACPAGSFCADCRCVANAFDPSKVYDPTGAVPPGAALIGPEEFELLIRNGAFPLTSADLERRRAEEAARARADRALVDAAVARHPELVDDLRLALPPGVPPDADSFPIDIQTPAGRETLTVHGTTYLSREVAAALRRFPERANQERMYGALFAALPPDEREGLPDPSALGEFSDEEVDALRTEVVRRADEVLPNDAPPVGAATASLRRLRDAPPNRLFETRSVSSSGCQHSSKGLLAKTTWPLQTYTTAIRSQGKRGTCSAHAAAAALEAFLHKFHGQSSLDLSEQELYAHAKGRWFPSFHSDGVPSGDLLSEMDARDFPLHGEGSWPYNPSWYRQENPVLFQYTDSCVDYPYACSDTNHQQGTFCTMWQGQSYCSWATEVELRGEQSATFELQDVAFLWNTFAKDASLANIRAHLAAGNPVIVTVTLDAAFTGLSSNQHGLLFDIPNLVPDSSTHAVLLTGYRSAASIDWLDLPTTNGHLYVAKNSWGCDWGDGGFAYIHTSWLRKRARNAIAILGTASANLPSIAIAASKSLVTASGSVTLTATGNNLAEVQYFEGFTPLHPQRRKTPPFALSINYGGDADSGTHVYWAWGWDAGGNRVESNLVQVKVVIDTTPPVVQLVATSGIVSPPAFPDTTLQAIAFDDTGVTRVEFFKRRLIPQRNKPPAQVLTKLGEDTTPPYEGQLSFGAGDVGTHTYVARAWDAAGNKKDSLPLTITVVPSVPPPNIVSFTATPPGLGVGGGQVTLAWSVFAATSLSIDQGVGAVSGATGSVTVAITQSTTFTLTASNSAGTDTAQVAVAVLPPIPTTTSTLPPSTTTTAPPTTTTTSSTSTTVTTLPGSADLRPTAFTASAAVSVPGQPMTVAFSVTNQGGAPATGTWIDQLWLSTDQQIDNPGDVFLGNVTRSGPLAPGDTYTVAAHPIVIPGRQPAGAYYLLLTSDVSNTVPESNNANNTWLSPLPLTLVTPDLVPTAFTASTATIVSGQQATVSFTVKNQGTGTAFGTWIDQLWLSTDQQIDNPGDVFLGNVTRSGPLAPGDIYTVAAHPIVIPGRQPAGAYYLLLRVDTTSSLFENGLDANNDWPAPIPITVQTPDLVPTAFTASAAAVDKGAQLTVSFTVENQGTGTAFGGWIDQLWLSTDQTIDNPGDVFLANINRSGPLAPAATYSVANQPITIPAAQASGAYYLLLRVDTTNALFENGQDANNDWPAPIPIAVN